MLEQKPLARTLIMPVEPFFGLGLAPILRLILPLAILWALGRRKLSSGTETSAR